MPDLKSFLLKKEVLIFNLFQGKIKYFLSCLLALVFYQINSQTLAFERLTTKNGLLSEDVYNLHQDKQGYLWVFSKFGTLKYNGFNFKPVLKNLPFKESFIYSIYENEKGQKWVANSNAQVYEVKNDSAFLIKGIEDVSESLRKKVSEIFHLYVDDSLNIYIITKGSSFRLVKKANGYEPINISIYLDADSVQYNLLDLGNESFAIASNGIRNREKYVDRLANKCYIRLARDGENLIVENPMYKLNPLTMLVPIRNLKKFDQNYYFLYSNLFGVLDKNNSFSFKKLKSQAINFRRDNSGHFWVGCLNGGVYELNEKGDFVNHYLDGVTVNDILFDHQGGLWLSSAGFGLYHCKNIKNLCFNKPDPRGMDIGLIKVIDSTVYITNRLGDVYSTKGNDYNYLMNKVDKEVYDIEKHDGRLVITSISTPPEFSIWKKNELRFTHGFNSLYNKLISKSKDTLIASTRQIVIYIVKGEIKKANYYYVKIMSLALHDDLLWMGTDNGVYALAPFFKSPSEILNRRLILDTVDISSNCVEGTLGVNVVKVVKGENEIWFCSQGNGLFLYKDRELKNFTKENGLPDDVINDFYIDKSGVVLLAANSGLYLSNRLNGGLTFDRWEKIHVGEVRNVVLFNGKIYIGAPEGLSVLEYSNVKKNNKKLFFNLASIFIDGKEVDAKTFSGLKSNQRTIEFNFDLIDFVNEKLPIRFYLYGSQVDSGYIENSHFRFSQLPPGNYSLVTYPEAPLGKLAGITIPFIVEPAFWQTNEFRFMIMFITLVVILLSFLIILRRNRKQQAVKMKNEQLLLEYKLIALKAQINPHFMSNCLSAIQDLVVSDKNDKATFYIAQFGLMVRQILDFSSKQLITLKEELDLLELYVELELLRFESKFEYDIEIENNISLKETYLPPLIFNPIVENAIWHGLLPIQGQKLGKLLITIKRYEGNLALCIEDNGVGRDVEKNTSGANKGKSYGIQITQQRLANINYLNNRKDARLIYTDLKNDENSASGTLVTIYLPDNLNPFQNEQD